MKNFPMISAIVSLLLAASAASAQVIIDIGSGNKPLVMNRIITESDLEAESIKLVGQPKPIMTISIRNRWRFDCYAPASAKECAEAAAIVQKAYSNMRTPLSLTGTIAPSKFETPKWTATCYARPQKCEEAASRIRTADMWTTSQHPRR